MSRKIVGQMLELFVTLATATRTQVLAQLNTSHRELTTKEIADLSASAGLDTLDAVTGGGQQAGSQRGRTPQRAGNQAGGKQRSRGDGLAPYCTLFDEVLVSIHNLKKAGTAPDRENLIADWKARKVKSKNAATLINAYLPIQKGQHETLDIAERGVHTLTPKGEERVKWYFAQRKAGEPAPSVAATAEEARKLRAKGNQTGGKQAKGKQTGRRATA